MSSQPLTPETLVYGLTSASDPHVSPDGRSIVYVQTTASEEAKQAFAQLWLCVSDGQRRQLTFSGTRNTAPRWSPDGRDLAFVSNRVEPSGLYLLPLADGGEPRLLARHALELDQPAWCPDGQHVAYVAAVDPDDPEGHAAAAEAAPRVRVTRRLDYKQDGRGYLNDVRRQVFVVERAGGTPRQLTHVPFDHALPTWSPDGQWLAAQRLNRNGLCSQLALIAAATGETRLVGPEAGTVDLWAWSPEGGRLLIAGDTALTWQSDFFIYDVAADTYHRLTHDLSVLPAGSYPGPNPSPPVWLDDQHVLFHALHAGRSGLHTLDCRTGDVTLVAEWPARHAGLSTNTERSIVVQAHSSPSAVGEIALFDRQAGSMRLLTQLNTATLQASPPARTERFTVERGGLAIDAWLLLPPDFDPARRYPVVLDVHGGPHNLYGDHFLPVQQCLATHGFLVVYANPRGSGSYGRSFAQQVVRDWGGEDYLDLMAVLDKLLEHPYADADRLGIHGYSYGGYMTAWAIGQTDRFRAAACGAPVFDFESFYGTSDIGHFFGEEEFGGPPHAMADGYAAHSPSAFAHRVRTPTLILQGEADERCPVGQGEQMFVALHKAGCEVEFVRYPGASHGFLGSGLPAHRADYLRRVRDWFVHHLGGPA